MSRVVAGKAALLVAATWVAAATARAENLAVVAAPERRSLVVTASTRPVHIQVIMVGRGPARAEMERAVRELVGTLPELTWTEGGGGPTDRSSPAMQVLIDVTDRSRVRIVAARARASTLQAPVPPPPVVREVVTDRLSAEVARETVAQIVQTTVRALLDPASEPGDAAPSSLLEPPPITSSLPSAPLPLPAPVAAVGRSEALSTATVIRAPASAPRRRARMYDAVISVGQHSFPYDLAGPLAMQPKLDTVAVALDRRFAVVTATARLSGEWSQISTGVVNVSTQVLTASAGASANLDVGPLSFALGMNAGALVIRQSTALSGSADQGAGLALGFPGVLWDAWSVGPMAELRSSLSIDLFSRTFVRLEAALPVAWLNTRDLNGDSAWRFSQYEQLMLGVGYHL